MAASETVSGRPGRPRLKADQQATPRAQHSLVLGPAGARADSFGSSYLTGLVIPLPGQGGRDRWLRHCRSGQTCAQGSCAPWRDGRRTRAAPRMYAIAHALEGLSRAEAARPSRTERQAMHDAVLCYNAEGLGGLHERPKGHRCPVQDQGGEAALLNSCSPGPIWPAMAARSGRCPRLPRRSRSAGASGCIRRACRGC